VVLCVVMVVALVVLSEKSRKESDKFCAWVHNKANDQKASSKETAERSTGFAHINCLFANCLRRPDTNKLNYIKIEKNFTWI
jgi:hypothetical protein